MKFKLVSVPGGVTLAIFFRANKGAFRHTSALARFVCKTCARTRLSSSSAGQSSGRPSIEGTAPELVTVAVEHDDRYNLTSTKVNGNALTKKMQMKQLMSNKEKRYRITLSSKRSRSTRVVIPPLFGRENNSWCSSSVVKK
ncbi:unnamed protein product [Amoebophrya sp. A25]|nr:unnamed protein product [Amoebophrya sp. A25]|eukprot:GSA25T00013676001.1